MIAIWIAAFMTLVVLLCVTDSFVAQKENSLPQGADSGIVLDFCKSMISQQRAI